MPHRRWTGRSIVSATIMIPQDIYNAQLMLRGNQLIIIGSYYKQPRETAIIDSSNVTLVAVYDIASLAQPKLVQHYLAPG